MFRSGCGILLYRFLIVAFLSTSYIRLLIIHLILIHICLVDFSTLINWMSPFPILGVSGELFHFFLFSIEIANSEDPNQTPCSAASDLGLHCLPMSQKWDARLILVKLVLHS